MTPNDIIFKMEHQFTLYLQRAGVSREKLPPIQLVEMRRAFYGGLGQMFFLISQDVVELPRKQVFQVYDSIVKQLGEFWDTEAMKAAMMGLPVINEASIVTCPKCHWKGEVKNLKKPTGDKMGKCTCPGCGSEELFFHY